METNLALLKGLHPGIVLDHELKKRNLAKGRFALSINEFPQTLGSITKGKRNMNTHLALRIEQALGMEEGYFMTLQIFYEIKEEKRKQHSRQSPDLLKLRPALFWDTNIEKIDWRRQRRAVIQRIFERGNEQEQQEIRKFYGNETVELILNEKRSRPSHAQ
jgi:antitoxin HigA-1